MDDQSANSAPRLASIADLAKTEPYCRLFTKAALRHLVFNARAVTDSSGQVIGPRLKAFAARLGDLKVRVEFGTGSLILRWRPTEDISWNLGSVTTAGKVWTEFLNSQADRAGLLDLSHKYQEQVAASVPGASVKRGATPLSWYVAKGGTYVMIADMLDHEVEWHKAIEDFVNAASAVVEAS